MRTVRGRPEAAQQRHQPEGAPRSHPAARSCLQPDAEIAKTCQSRTNTGVYDTILIFRGFRPVGPSNPRSVR